MTPRFPRLATASTRAFCPCPNACCLTKNIRSAAKLTVAQVSKCNPLRSMRHCLALNSTMERSTLMSRNLRSLSNFQTALTMVVGGWIGGV
jgi:hypothetical protein